VIKPDMTFFYFQHQVDLPAPLLPNLVHVGGMHVSGKGAVPKPIPDALLKAIESKPKGFIIVSTGHWARFEFAAPETKQHFIEAFSRIANDGYAVIWQYEGDVLEDLADGVHRFDWLPQRELLAHPKIRAFVSHCGCNSALEAIMNGVPVAGLGLFADQVSTAAVLEAKGICVRLDKKRLSTDVIYNSIIRLVTDESIRAKSKLFASIVAHEPMKPIDRAIFWSEHLLRHKGGKWMRSRLPANLSDTIKYYCIDVIGMMLGVLFFSLFIAFKIIFFFYRLVAGEKSVK